MVWRVAQRDVGTLLLADQLDVRTLLLADYRRQRF